MGQKHRMMHINYLIKQKLDYVWFVGCRTKNFDVLQSRKGQKNNNNNTLLILLDVLDLLCLCALRFLEACKERISKPLLFAFI